MDPTPCIRLHRVSKRFGGVAALDDVSVEIGRGEVHAVVGENGAGKSTLMKLLAGIHEPDEGEIQLDGETVRLENPREAQRRGISIVFQELNLFPHRTVTANIFANRELAGPWGFVRGQLMREATRRVLSNLDANLSPDAIVGSLAIGERQLVEIARALEQQPKILILDEPNSALNETESVRLFEIIRRLRARGLTIVYVSHRLEEVFAIADRITVLRDGHYQGTWSTVETTIPKIIVAMIGRRLDESFPQRPAASAPGAVVLEVRALESFHIEPISFSARAGEIVGFAGLEGSGIDELFQALFRLNPLTGGQILVRGRLEKGTTPLAAIRHGWALVPKSRREQGLMMDWSIDRNATMLTLEKLLTRLRLIDKRAVRDATVRCIRRLGISTDRFDEKATNLSGGNQQKVLLAKWLATEPSILILNDPTRGVDVAAKRDIYQLCRDLAAQGMTLLLTSSEAEEIVGLADRALVLCKGKLVCELHRDQMTKSRLMHAMSGAN